MEKTWCKTERKIYTFLLKDRDNHPPEGGKQIPLVKIAKALKMKLPTVQKAVMNITGNITTPDEEIISIATYRYYGKFYKKPGSNIDLKSKS